MKLKSLIFIFFSLICSILLAQQWDNPENRMLSDTMTSFFYYTTKDPVAFSDPNGIKEMEQHAARFDNYQNDRDIVLERVKQQRLQQEIIFMKKYEYYNKGSGLITPYP